jgi:hypothetical protein
LAVNLALCRPRVTAFSFLCTFQKNKEVFSGKILGKTSEERDFKNVRLQQLRLQK